MRREFVVTPRNISEESVRLLVVETPYEHLEARAEMVDGTYRQMTGVMPRERAIVVAFQDGYRVGPATNFVRSTPNQPRFVGKYVYYEDHNYIKPREVTTAAIWERIKE